MIVGVAILLGVLIRYCAPPMGKTVLKPTGKEASSPNGLLPSHAIAGKDSYIGGFLDQFKNPITLYGKVVDQHEKPIPGAVVELSALDSPSLDKPSSTVKMSTDAEGKFSIKGIKGFSLGVQVTKNDCIYLPPVGGQSSSKMIYYSDGNKEGSRYSNPATPLILHLIRIESDESVFCMDQIQWNLPSDGTVRSIALDSKKGTGSHQIEFRFKSEWNKLPKDHEINTKTFEWSFEARIPGGGFVWNDDNYNFEAPETGYKEVINYHISGNQPRAKWPTTRHGRFFVKFADGSYGRIRFEIAACSTSWPLDMTSWLNLKPGSRNLASRHGKNYGADGNKPDGE